MNTWRVSPEAQAALNIAKVATRLARTAESRYLDRASSRGRLIDEDIQTMEFVLDQWHQETDIG